MFGQHCLTQTTPDRCREKESQETQQAEDFHMWELHEPEELNDSIQGQKELEECSQSLLTAHAIT